MSKEIQLGAFTVELADDKSAVTVRNVPRTWSMSFTPGHNAYMVFTAAIHSGKVSDEIRQYLEMYLTMAWSAAQVFPDVEMMQDFYTMVDSRIKRNKEEPERELTSEELSELIALEHMRSLTDTEEKAEALAREAEQEIKRANDESHDNA